MPWRRSGWERPRTPWNASARSSPSVWPSVRGAAQIRQDLLRQTLGYYRDFVAQAKDKPDLQADLALTYSKIGTLSEKIGSIAEAIAADTQAIDLFRELAVANPRDTDYRRRLGVCENNLALALWRSGRTDEALRAFTEADPPSGRSPGRVGRFRAKISSTWPWPTAVWVCCKMKRAMRKAPPRWIGRAVELQEQLLRSAPDDPERLRNLAETLNNLAALYKERQPAKAIQEYERAAVMQKKAVELRPDESVYRSDLALTYNNLGVAQSRSGDVAQAAESYAKAVDLAGELVRQAPAETSYRRRMAIGLNNLGEAQSKLGHATAAEPSFRRALELQEPLVKQDPRDVESRSTLGAIVQRLGSRPGRIEPPGGGRHGLRAGRGRAAASRGKCPGDCPVSAIPQQTLLQLRPRTAANGTPQRRRSGRLGAPRTVAQRPAALVLRRRGAGLDRQGSFCGQRRQQRRNHCRLCGAYAVETLKQATAAGWKPAPNSNWTKSFLTVKNRADFLELTRN